ncbi:MAG: hypothetical protein AB7H88_12680 [Vicinamibacterales bacterium]
MTRRGVIVSLGLSALTGAGLYWGPSPAPAPAHEVPSPDEVTAALAEGAPMRVSPDARAHLELSGFTFAPGAGPDGRFAVSGRLRCTGILADRWSPLPGLEYTGRLGVEVPPGSHAMALLVGDTLPVRVRATLPDGQPVPLPGEPLTGGPGTGQAPPDYWLEDGDPLGVPQRVTRFTIPADPLHPRLLAIDLGRRAPRVLARMTGPGATGRVCAAPLAGDPWFAPAAPPRVDLPLGDLRIFGTGWFGVAGGGPSAGARLAGEAAAVLVPLADAADTAVTLVAAPAAAGLARVALEVNGVPQAAWWMDDAWGDYTWRVPARTWVEGTNELVFRVEPAAAPAGLVGGELRAVGMAVQALRLSR